MDVFAAKCETCRPCPHVKTVSRAVRFAELPYASAHAPKGHGTGENTAAFGCVHKIRKTKEIPSGIVKR
ncbi:MAG: hypothetical protein DBY25_06195 [Clostridiales bacterium]|nr:MAG: hypothetical protein DBY25_06195 [Clostridiales bacterium]